MSLFRHTSELTPVSLAPQFLFMRNVHRRVGKITVLALYTAEGMADLQSVSAAGMETKIGQAYEKTQKALRDSGIALNIKLVKTVSVGFFTLPCSLPRYYYRAARKRTAHDLGLGFRIRDTRIPGVCLLFQGLAACSMMISDVATL